MTEETIKNVAWCVVFAFGIQAFTIYATMRLFVLGRGVFERKEDQQIGRAHV